MTSKPNNLEHVAGERFGPSDTVALDGKSFFLCTFDRCEVVYGGGDMAHEGCTFSGCRITFVGPAHATVQWMLEFGFQIISPGGEKPETKFFQ
jgi:hypothetical protein